MPAKLPPSDMGGALRERWIVVLVLLSVAQAGTGVARSQPVAGDVRTVGFAGPGETAGLIRIGQWFPILVELTAQSSEHQSVYLRYETVDADGDRVAYAAGPIALTAGGGIQTAWCYAATAADGIGRFTSVDVLDATGSVINRLPLPTIEPIGDDTHLLLDIGRKQVTGLRDLDTGSQSYFYSGSANLNFLRPLCVARLAERSLPDRWIGLSAVDSIVWDEPDLTGLESAQLEALHRWVERGGTLIVGIGPAWTTLQKSSLADLLPFSAQSTLREVETLPGFHSRYGGPPAQRFRTPISLVTGALAPDARALLTDGLPDGARVTVLAQRSFGGGQVIACAARLRDLLDEGGTGDAAREPDTAVASRRFVRDLLNVAAMPPELAKREAEQAFTGLGMMVELYGPLLEPIEFRSQAGVLLLLVIGFVFLYAVAALAGSWTWLRRRSLTQYAWPVFAGVAVVASVLSLGAVSLLRGVRGSVHSVSVVDFEAGSTRAGGWALFGYKCVQRGATTLSLPGEDTFLRPLSAPPDVGARYATPLRYSSDTRSGVLNGVPLRATLKQFEGYWRGTLDGTVRAQLTVDRGTGQVTPESWIQNDLTEKVVSGELLFIDPRMRDDDGEVPRRVGARARWIDGRRYWDNEFVPPAAMVLRVPLGELAPGVTVRRLGQAVYTKVASDLTRWSLAENPDPKREPMLPTLWSLQTQEWMAGSLAPTLTRLLQRVRPPVAALMLASTRDLFVHSSGDPDFGNPGLPVRLQGLPRLDVSQWLTRGQAILLLVVDSPGPARLYSNNQPLAHREGLTVYRVRVPVDYVGSPPAGRPIDFPAPEPSDPAKDSTP